MLKVAWMSVTTWPVLHNNPVQYDDYRTRPKTAVHTSQISLQHILWYWCLRIKKEKSKLSNKNLNKNCKNGTQNSGKQSSWVSGNDNVSCSLGKWKSLYSINWPFVSCLLLSVCYVTSCSPGERLSNTSARPTIGGNHHFNSYFKYILNIFTFSFS